MPCDTNKTSSEIEHVDWSNGTGGSGHNYATVRFGSGSSQASQSSGDICRICHCESDPQNPLLTPCYCAGSLKYVHQSCLQQWLTASETNSCELCKFPFIMHTKIKPFNEWRSLDISGVERRRLCCSVLFHCAAALCVIWSLCVLIERAADDVQRGHIDWPFWTKLAVVTVGLTGGVVFMYIQCKAYLHLCHRWKARNRILLIQNAPEKVHPASPPSPTAHHAHCHHHHAEAGEPHSSSAVAGGLAGSRDLEAAGNSAMAPLATMYNYAPMSGVPSGPLGGGGPSSAAAVVEIDAGGHQLHHHAQLTHHHHPHHVHHSHHHAHHHTHHHHHGHPHSDDFSTGSSVTPHDAAVEPGDPAAGHSGHHALAAPSQTGQVAVSANIECSQLQQNYERDWALDDVVSQISSFRPCPQGSGSMTPFHDSIHNVLENSEGSAGSLRASVNDVCGGSRQDLSTGGTSTDTGREHGLQLSSYSGSGDHKAPSISSGVSNAVANGLGGFVYKPHTKRYSNSSIFLENRDILNDSVTLDLESASSAGVDYRRSTSLMATAPNELRASDESVRTRSRPDAGAGATASTPTTATTDMPTGANASQPSRVPPLLRKQYTADTVLDMELPESPLSPALYGRAMRPSTLGSATSAMAFVDHRLDRPGDGGGQPLDEESAAAERRLSSQQKRQQYRQPPQQIDKGRLFFQSLPNLSSSCESLIKK